MATRKRPISHALKQSIWLEYNGKTFEAKCQVSWCKNIVTVYNFEAGHNIPESKGGTTTLDNLRPICGSCNKSMGNRYTIDEFSNLYAPKPIPGNNKIYPEESTTVKVKTGCFGRFSCM